jgi:hypothetical protein
MLVALGCVIGLTAAIAIARALKARSTLNENRGKTISALLR